MTAVRRCSCGCGDSLPIDAHPLAKYVDNKHKRRMEARRRRARKRDESKPRRYDAKTTDDRGFRFTSREESKDGRASYRRGPGYERFLQTEWPGMVAREEVTAADAAEALDVKRAHVSQWMASYHEDLALGKAREGWSREDPVEECLRDFEKFCRRYWPEDMFTDYMGEWSTSINESIDHGGRLLLLTPQRHFKTDTLTKWCVWRICLDFNIRLLWVSQTQDLAEKAVGYVLDILTTHEQLKEDILGPGGEFRPPQRNNMSWTSQQFTVGVRTKTQKSPTMVALGKGGSVLSRDADGIVVDDLQEHKHIRSPGQRETDIEWFFSDLTSRKMPHTGLAVIGSRQHLQDVYSEILKRSEQWTTLTYRVHDPGCTINEGDHEAHDGSGCMLNPDWYPHEFMEEQRAQQGEAYFQRNMMNNPKSDATILVSAEDLNRCKDHDRRAGDMPRGVTRLVAGIDPADSKPVAGVLWGFERDWGDRGRRHVIDIMEADAGIRGGRQILKAWKDLYGCTLFILESNMAKSWLEDTDIREFQAKNGVMLEPQYTSASTKWSDSTGVVAMFGKMRVDPPEITIPWGDRETQKKMERLTRTFLMFDPDYANHKHADDDLPMAAWFPQLRMDGWMTPRTAWAEKDYRSTPYVMSRTPYPARHLESVA